MQQGETEDIDRSGGKPHNRDHRHDDRQNRRRPGNEQAGARTTSAAETRARLILVWRTDAVRTPTAIPVPSANRIRLKSAPSPAMTSSTKIAPRYEHAAADHPRGQADVDRPDDRVDRDELPALAEFAERPSQIPVPPLRAESLLAGAAGQ